MTNTSPSGEKEITSQKEPGIKDPKEGITNIGTGTPDTKKKHRYILLTVLLVILVIGIILVITVSTLSIDLQLAPLGGVSYPYTTTYSVEMEEGIPHDIGGIKIVFLSIDDEIFLRIGEEKVKMETGEKKTITERRAKITTLGFPVLDTNYMIVAQYLGMSGKNANFHISLKTSEQVPGYLIDRILPGDIRAVPV